jgi:hypothetical protein
MKQNLLSMVQSILNSLEGTPVNSIADTEEAMMIASAIRDTYFNMIAARIIPEFGDFIKIDAVSDTNRPTHFRYNENVKEITSLHYNVATDGGVAWREIKWLEPLDFVNRLPSSGRLVDTGKTSFYVGDEQMPSFYTSFDDEYIVMNAFDKSVDDTLQQSKTRAFGYTYPTFSLVDTFVPDLDNTLFPYLLAESKSVCFSLYKGPDPKIEQAARRLKTGIQNDMTKTRKENVRPRYGRR